MRRLIAKLTVVVAMTSLLVGGTAQASPVGATLEFDGWAGPLQVDGNPTNTGRLTFHICVDTDAQDNWGTTDFGNFPVLAVRLTAPDLSIQNELVTSAITYFEDNAPERAGLSLPYPSAGIVVRGPSLGTILDPNIVNDPLPSIQGNDGLWSRMVLSLDTGMTIGVPVGGVLAANASISPGALNACVISVGIDIKPDSDPNSINLCSNGAVPIAILGADDFDVYDIETETLRFADAAVKVVGKKDPYSLCSYHDVNGDGLDDLVCHFVTADIAALDGDSTSAAVNGELIDGTPITGTDSIKIVKDTCN